MTIEKDRVIRIPIWLVSILLPLIVALITTFIALAGVRARLELQAEINKSNIETLRMEKVGSKEFSLVIEKLNTIEAKLDGHIDK